MKKKDRFKPKFIFIYILVFFICFLLSRISHASESTYQCGMGLSTETGRNESYCGGLGTDQYQTALGYYTDYDSAYTAAAAALEDLKVAHPQYNQNWIQTLDYYTLSGGGDLEVDSNMWHAVVAFVHRTKPPESVNCKGWYVYAMFPNPDWKDENFDCILDGEDLCIDNPELCEDDCKYRKVLTVKDENMAVKAELIVTNKNQEYWIGNPAYAEDCISGDNPETDCNITRYLEIGSKSWSPCTLLSVIASDIAGTSTSNQIDLYPDMSVKTNIEGIETGTNTEVGDTDSEILGKTNDNLTVVNDNLRILGDKLAQIEANTRQGIGTGSVSGSGVSIVEQTGQGSIAQNGDDEISTIKDKIDNVDQDLTTEMPLDNLSDYEYGASDIAENDQGTIAEMLDSFLLRSPTSDFLDKISLTSSSPVCDFNASFDLFGKDISLEFSFCGIEDYLDMMGGLLFILSGISFIVIIFK